MRLPFSLCSVAALLLLATACEVGGSVQPLDQAPEGPDATAATPDAQAGIADAAVIDEPENSGVMADFMLEDVNATSPRFGTPVSPRDFLGGVSVWYLSHAT